VTNSLLNSSQDVVYRSGLCYVAANNRLVVVDVSTPATPSVVGNVSHSHLSDTRAVEYDPSTGLCYATSSSARALAVVDVSTPATPSVVGSVVDTTNLWVAEGFALSGRICYIGARASGRFTVVDATNPAAPAVVGSYAFDDSVLTREPSDVIYRSGYCFVADATADTMAVMDVADPSDPLLVSEITLTTGAEYMARSGDYILAGSAPDDSVTVIEIDCV